MTCDLFAHPSPNPVAKLTVLPYSQAPELLLPRAASLRQDLLFLQDQWGLRGGNLSVKTSLPPGPSTQGMLALPAFSDPAFLPVCASTEVLKTPVLQCAGSMLASAAQQPPPPQLQSRELRCTRLSSLTSRYSWLV